jgi:hypothetical protein
LEVNDDTRGSRNCLGPSLGLIAALLGGPALAQPAEVASLFPLRGAVRFIAPSPGETQPLVRLPLPVEVLAQSRADLSDLRLLDEAGHEVPFLLEASPRTAGRAGAEVRAILEARPRLLGMAQNTIDPDDAPPLRRERYDLEAPPSGDDTTADGPWSLVVDSALVTFVRSIDLAERPAAASGDSTQPLLSGGSLFRLGDGRELRRYALPPLPPGSSLVVEIEGEDGSYLVPSFRYERSRRVSGGATADRSSSSTARAMLELLEIVEQRQEQGETVLELDREAGIVPQSLVFETTTAAFRRPVEVRDLGAGGDGRRLGAGVIFRVPAAGETIESLRVDLLPAVGTRLEVRFADGDSPPLAIGGVFAEIASPALLFAPPAGAAGVTLHCGGGRARRPRYDLAGLLPELPAAGTAARIGAALLDPRRATPATLDPLEPNPRHVAGPVLAAAMRPGAELDERVYSHQRRLSAPSSETGLARLELRPEDLALARADLADLRVADPQSRQWPYLLRAGAGTELVELDVAATTEQGRTRLRLSPQASPLELRGLELEVATPFFDRPYLLEAELPEDGGTVPLSRGELRRHGRDGGDGADPAVGFSPRRVVRLILTIEDGSEQPLEVRGASAVATRHELLFPAPAGEYRLLLGFPAAEAPVYDLTRAREVVLALEPATVESGPLEPNPAASAVARWGRGDAPVRLLVWGAIVLAVAVLTVLTLRLAGRREDEGTGA